MNRKQRRIIESQNKHSMPVIRLEGKSYTVEQANLQAAKERNLGKLPAAAEIYRLLLATVHDNSQLYNNQSVILQEMGRHAEALASCDKAIALGAGVAAFHYNRGNTLQTLTRYEEALASYDKAIALQADYVEAYNNRGATLQHMSRYKEALANYDKVIALDPDHASAHNNRGVLLQKMGKYAESLASCDKAIAIKPDYADAYSNRAVTLQKMGRYEDSLASCDKAIALRADYAEAYNNRAVSLQKMKRHEESLASCDKALTLKPDYANAYNNRGIALHDLKRFDEALASYDKAISLQPDHANTYSNMGITLHELKRYGEALASCDKAIALDPDYADAYQLRGVIMVDEGNMQEGEKMFLRVLALDPAYNKALFSLANIRHYKNADHPDFKTLHTLLAESNPSAPEREYFYFALGKMYDDCGLYDEAFAAYRQANEILNAQVQYIPGLVAANTGHLIKTFTKDLLAQHFSLASDSRSPVFIVGMPRSGTTLMASILSNHPSIGTAGELPTITELTLRLPTLLSNPLSDPQAATQLTKSYEERLRRDLGPELPYIIDKHPLNFRHLGLITLLFPKARIIHCMRHPLDTGLSNYFQRFILSYNYSFDLQNTGHFYGEYARLTAHWRKVLPGNMIEIVYEDMVSDTESAARRMLEFLEVPWDERCLSPHTNRYVVETSSKWQVRQPIYTRAVERWRHYEKHLTPLKDALERAGQWPV